MILVIISFHYKFILKIKLRVFHLVIVFVFELSVGNTFRTVELVLAKNKCVDSNSVERELREVCFTINIL